MASASPSDPEEGARLRREIECLNARIKLEQKKSEIELDFYSSQTTKNQEFERNLHYSLREEIRSLRTTKDAVEIENQNLRRDNQALESMTHKFQTKIHRIEDQLEMVQKAYLNLRSKSPPCDPRKSGGKNRDGVNLHSAGRSHGRNGENASKSDTIDKDSEIGSGGESRRLDPDEIVHTTPCNHCREHYIPCIGSQGRRCRACQGWHKRCEKSSQGSTKRKEREEEEKGAARPTKRQEP